MKPPSIPQALPQSAMAFVLDPDRRVASGVVVGLAALLAAWGVSGANGIAAAYLGAWICLLALPAGALPVVIMIERADAWRPQPETALLETLRWLLALMPVAGLLSLPILFLLPSLYPWARGAPPETPLAAIWFTLPFFAARLAVYFAVWIALARLFTNRGGEPSGKAGRIDDGRAVVGLGLHIFAGTCASIDLVMSVAAHFHSTLSGLLLMSAWSGLALSAAILFAPPDIGPARRRLDRLTPLAVLLAIWAFLHFIQYFTLWSANRPDEAAWYAARSNSDARALALFAGFVVLLAVILTLKPGENRTRLVAALALAAHGMEMFWFVTPSLRGSFKIALADVLALLGLLCLAAGLLPLTRRVLPGPVSRKAAREAA